MLNKLMEVSKEYEKKGSIEVCVKTMEELGELSQALLSSKDICGCGYKNLTRDDVLEEVADVIICATSLAEKEGFNALELEEMIYKKINKWMVKIKGAEIRRGNSDSKYPRFYKILEVNVEEDLLRHRLKALGISEGRLLAHKGQGGGGVEIIAIDSSDIALSHDVFLMLKLEEI